MEEPSRIGLTAVTGGRLDELLDELNPTAGDDGVKLIKFDIYRLAVALGMSNSEPPPALSEKSVSNLRVQELDPNGVLALAIENSNLVPAGTSTYEYIERLAERGINEICDAYEQTGQLPIENYFTA